MAGRTRFIAAIGAAFPTLSYTAQMKCWQDVHHVPDGVLGELYAALLLAATAATEARATQTGAIVQSIGTESRR